MKKEERLKKFGKAMLKGLDLIDETHSFWLYRHDADDSNCGCAVGLGLVGWMESFEKAWKLYANDGMSRTIKKVTGLDEDDVNEISNLHEHGIKARKIAKRLIKHGEIPKESSL